MLLFSLLACSNPVAVPPAPPPTPLTLSGPTTAIAGEPITLTLSGSILDPGDILDVGWGPTLGAGPCPYSGLTGGSPCMDITGPAQLLGRTTATGPTAGLTVAVPAGSPSVHVQAFLYDRSGSHTSNVLTIDVRPPLEVLGDRVDALDQQVAGLEGEMSALSADVHTLDDVGLATNTDLSALRSLFSGRTLYLPFEDGIDQLTFDLSGFQQTGSLVGGAHMETSTRPGFVLELDGQDDYVLFEDHPIQRALHRGLTAMAWMKLDETPHTHAMIVSKHYTNGSRAWDLRLLPDQSLMFQISDNTPWRQDPTTGTWSGNQASILAATGHPIPLAVWTHVAATWDRNAGRTVLYIDGAEVSAQSVPTNLQVSQTTVPLLVGAYNDNSVGTAPRSLFNGQIDEVMLYNRALSAEEIAAVWRLTR